MRNMSNRYLCYGVALLAVLLLMTILTSIITGAALISFGIIGFVFQLVCIAAYWAAWKKVSVTSPKNLPVLYMAASGIRLTLASIVILVYMFTHRTSDTLLPFSLVFAVFYIVTLIYDTLYFVSVEKNKKR